MQNGNVGDFGSKREDSSCYLVYTHTSMLSHANRHIHMHSLLSYLLNTHTHTHTHPQQHNCTLCYHTQKHMYKNQFDYKRPSKLKCMACDLCCHIKMSREQTKWSWDET